MKIVLVFLFGAIALASIAMFVVSIQYMIYCHKEHKKNFGWLYKDFD